ncbi:MAG: hypothetical protein HQK84_08415, partial [Nitrospinae bacterium]|nr:hypothetical protein [Nitrospinota bacterium]
MQVINQGQWYEKVISNNVIIFLLIFTVGVFIYGDVLGFEFSKDDFFSILPIPGIAELSTIPKFFISPVQFYVHETETLHNLHYYRPIATSTLTLDFFFWGVNHPGWFHFENLLIHIVNSFILFLVFTHIIKREIALLGAISYLVFPLSTEIISIYHYRVDLTVTFFIFLTLLVTVKVEGDKWKYYASFLFLLAMLSKEIGIVLLIFIPFLRHYVYKKINIRDIFFICLAPMIIYWSLRYNALGGFIRPVDNYFNLDNFSQLNITFGEKMEVIVDSFFTRIYWVFSPFQIPSRVLLGMEGYRFFLPGIFLLLSLTLSALYYLKRGNAVSLSSLFILTAWFPLSSILVAVPDSVSPRLFYYLAPWIILLLFLIFDKLPSRFIKNSLMIFCICIWGSSAYAQKYWYKNDLANALGTLDYYPEHPVYLMLTGSEYRKRGEDDKAIEYVKRSLFNLYKEHNGIEGAIENRGTTVKHALAILSDLYIKK